MTNPNWAIPEDLLAANTRLVADDPETRDTSLTAILERRVSRSWAPKQRCAGIAFISESGQFFQLRYLENPPVGKNGNPQRYDSVEKAGYRYFYPTIPESYRQQIAAAWAITVPDSGSFWEWFQQSPKCPLFDPEGPAKALSLVGLGYPAASGFGAFGGVERNEYRTFKRSIGKRKSGKSGGYTVEKVPLAQPRLPKGLADLATKGRRITLVPDMDANPKTRRSVANAFLHRARLLEKRGCSVRIAYWDSQLGKGIDDVLDTHGETVTRQILDNPLTPAEFALKIELSFDLATPNAIVNTRNLQIDSPELPKEGLVFSDSVTGSGKTKLAARETDGRTVLAPYPLRSLAKAAAKGLNATYRNEGKLNRVQKAYYEGDTLSDRLTIVYDSLPRIDLKNQFGGELEDLLLDEVTHGLRHALTGATCREERLQIAEKFVEAVRSSKRVLAFDADLTRTELDILRELRPNDSEFYLKNTRKPDPWEIHWLTLASSQPTIGAAIEALTQLIARVRGEGLIHWACDGRETSEKIAAHLGLDLCAIVNSRSLREKCPKAIAAIAGAWDHPVLQGVRYIVTSPSIVQGVSWEDTGQFKLVVGTFSGCSITPRQMRQSLSRVREAIPRFIWASPHRRIPGKWGNDTNPNKIKSRILRISGFNTTALKEVTDLTETRSLAVDYAARLLAADNLWLSTPAASLRVLLEDYGHQIKPMCIDCDGQAFAATAEDWQAQQDQALMTAPAISRIEAESLKAQAELERLTSSERLSLQRFEICQFYAIQPEDLTLELIEKDREGLRHKVTAFEQLFSPDGQELAMAAVRSRSSGADIDCDRSLAALTARQNLRVPELIKSFRESGLSKDSPALIEFADRCHSGASDIKSGLNYSVRVTVSPVQLAADLLGQIGLSLTKTKRRTSSGVVNSYLLSTEDWEFLNSIAERRYQQRVRVDSGGDPPPSLNSNQRGVDHPEKTSNSLQNKDLDNCSLEPEGRDNNIPPIDLVWDDTWAEWVSGLQSVPA